MLPGFQTPRVYSVLSCLVLRCNADNSALEEHVVEVRLHWFDVPSRVQFKLCCLAFRCLHGSAPPYLAGYFTSVSSIEGRSQLRSAAAGLLLVPRTRTVTIGPRAFAVSSPAAWNSLPASLRDPSISLPSFRKKLKTYLFNTPT